MTLFDENDLTEWLGKPVTQLRAASVERVVWGWLKPILDLEERPDPAPAEVFAWAIELGGIAHENPKGLTQRELGPYSEHFSAERRKEILDEARDAQPDAGASMKPTGCFPEPLDYPDGTW